MNRRVRSRVLLALPLVIATLGACADKDPDATPEVVPEETPVELDLWAGVPPLEPHPGDIASVLEPRPGPELPPTISETIELPFPPELPTSGTPPSVATGPLKVERFGPTGPQELVDAIRVTFDQPMVPIAAVEALATKVAPIEIDPRPAGKTRWLGTKTLAFYPDGRLPYSTTFTVRIPAGTKSMAGTTLASATKWEITTPTLALASSSPWAGAGGIQLDPTITLTFNQPVQRIAVLASLKLKGKGKAVEFSAVEAEGTATMEDWQKARIVAIKPKVKLEPNTTYSVALPAGVFGEGPNKSAPIEVKFSTYPPLTLTKSACYGPCYAGNGISLVASNPLADPKLEDKVHITPAVEDLQITSGWNGIQLGGKFTGDTTYKVTVDAGLIDAFGQTLAKPFKASIRLGPWYPEVALSNAARTPGVIERGAAKELRLRIAGIDKLELEGRALAVSEAAKFFDVYSSDGMWGWPAAAPASSWTKTLDVEASRKKRQEMAIDLGEMLGAKNIGWVIARSNELKQDTWKWRAGLSQLIEVTDLGVAAALDRDSGLVQVTSLATGAPVSDVDVKIELSTTARTLWSGKTDADGLAEVEMPPRGDRYEPLVLVATKGDDAAFMRLDQNDLRGQWRYEGSWDPTPKAFIFTERTPYKPGDTIHLVGILRQETRGPSGGVEIWRQSSTAKYKVVDPRGIDVATGDAKIGAFGTFSVDIPTKAEGGTGNYQFSLEVPNLFAANTTFWHSIPVETYRAPEFTVAVGRPESKPLVYDDLLVAEIEGEYLHGAPLVGGEVSYTLTRSTSDFRPPGSTNDSFTFGNGGGYRPWMYRRFDEGRWGGGGWGTVTLKTATGTLDTLGKLVVEHKVVAKEPPPEGTVVPPPVPGATEDEGPPLAATYSINAVVTDENRQAIAGSASFVVHPARVYVGLRSARSVLREGEQTDVEAVLVDLEGERKTGTAVGVDVMRRDTTRKAIEKNGVWTFEYKTEETKVHGCALTSDAAPVTCSATFAKAGTYVVRGIAKDAAGKENRSEITIYVHGKDEIVWEQQDERRVDLVPDKKTYAPGDTAKLLVRSPFTNARGVVLVEREGIAEKFPIVVEGGAHAVEIPITEAMVGGVTVSAMLTRGRVEVPGAPAGQDLGMPAAASGQVDLDISAASKTIEVVLEPHAREIEPKGSLSLVVKTKRADTGEALPAAVAIMVVDEGVLSLMDYKTPDPMAFFHQRRAGGTWLHALHAHVLPRQEPVAGALGLATSSSTPADGSMAFGGFGRGSGAGDDKAFAPGALAPPSPEPTALAEEAEASKPKKASKPAETKPAARRSKGEEGRMSGGKDRDEGGLDPAKAMAQPVSLRTVFATTAFFDAEVVTDENGDARLDIPMPENLTTFRIMAVAVDPSAADRFGKGESTVRVRKPLMLRPSLPRFANIGDEFEGSVMVDNQTGEAQSVLVGTRGLNVVYGGETEKVLEIPSGESREVRFDMAVDKVGTMRLQFAAMSNAGRDATEITIPVHYPATAKAFADYGMTDGSVQHTIEPPADALPAFGGLEVSMSSTALSGLEDAVSYLVDYPYECAEQTASRILPIFALADVIEQFPIASLRDKSLRDDLARTGIERLLTHQLYDGGFGYWRADESWPYLTNWVTFALLEGKRQGYEVRQDALDRALTYIENFVQYGYRTRWGEYYDWTSRAFGLWLLSGEKRGSALFDTVWAHRNDMPLYGRLLLAGAAHRYGRTKERDVVLEELKDGVVESARTIHFAESRSEAAKDGLRVLMHSNVQTDAIALMALLEIDGTDARLPKIMAGIMDDRDPKKGGRWMSTHANAWVLLAASRYFETVEKDEPDYLARIWVDQNFAGEQAFRGRSMAKVDQKIPMSMLQGAATRQLTLGKEGPGKLYYRLGLRYAPEDLKMPAQDQGFTVTRQYEPLAGSDGKIDPTTVQQTDDGAWVVKAGT
ncbi:MAG TPA: Ig-like domain-containing protein, partial [Nannocystaceae bacterium]|nr:Ig-like domain-containing protein [Nannocystaceae bacterium]